jgi:hypothetical protein
MMHDHMDKMSKVYREIIMYGIKGVMIKNNYGYIDIIMNILHTSRRIPRINSKLSMLPYKLDIEHYISLATVIGFSICTRSNIHDTRKVKIIHVDESIAFTMNFISRISKNNISIDKTFFRIHTI